jgi:Domain of unknown function (DUF1995)
VCSTDVCSEIHSFLLLILIPSSSVEPRFLALSARVTFLYCTYGIPPLTSQGEMKYQILAKSEIGRHARCDIRETMIAGFTCIILALLSTTACAFPAEIVTSLPATKRSCAIHTFQYWRSPPRALSSLKLSHSGSPEDEADSDDDDDGSNSKGNRSERRRSGRKDGRSRSSPTAGRGFGMVNQRRGGGNSTTGSSTATVVDAPDETKETQQQMEKMAKRMTQLESLVAKQSVEIRKLKDECRTLQEVAVTFHHVIELLRAAGLQTDKLPSSTGKQSIAAGETTTNFDHVDQNEGVQSDDEDDDEVDDDEAEMDEDEEDILDDDENINDDAKIIYEYFDDAEIFGEVPSSVTDAADHAGAAILAGVLGGKQRMLVDVRDSELSGDPDTLVQFIELAILPVAAGLEGLLSSRNRVKLVFPTVSQLLQYRKKMALSAPEVVALSTLGFDPVEDQDNIVVILAPSPDDEEGLRAMNELLEPPEWKKDQWISQPVVVLNHHMVPISGPAASFEVMYHLRLLSVQYMSGDRAASLFSPFEEESQITDDAGTNVTATEKRELVDTLLEEAMRHAHQPGAGVHHGITRAMVIRSYPK